MPSLLGQVQNCCSSSPVTQNEHSVHIGGSGGSKFHLPNPHCETRLHVSSQTLMPDGPDWLACTPEYCCTVVQEYTGTHSMEGSMGLPPLPVSLLTKLIVNA